MLGVGWLSFLLQEIEPALARTEESLEIMEKVENFKGAGEARSYLGYMFIHQGDLKKARILFEESIADYQKINYSWGISHSLLGLSQVKQLQGDKEGTRVAQEEGLKISQELGDIEGAKWKAQLGVSLRFKGNHSEAARLLGEALEVFRRIKTNWAIAETAGNLAYALIGLGKYGEAKPLLLETLQLQLELREKGGVAWALEGLSMVAAGTGQFEQAALLLGFAEKLRQIANQPLLPNDKADYAELVAKLKQNLNEEMLNRYWAEGQTATIQQILQISQELACDG